MGYVLSHRWFTFWLWAGLPSAFLKAPHLGHSPGSMDRANLWLWALDPLCRSCCQRKAGFWALLLAAPHSWSEEVF